MERLANSAMQFIFNSRRDESITPYRIQLAWLTMKRRMEYFLGCVMFNILKHKLPLPNYEAIKTCFQDIRRSARRDINSAHIVVPNNRTSAFKGSFIVNATKVWSELSSRIRESPSAFHIWKILICIYTGTRPS